jgi:transposase InsO family protein
LRSPDRHEYGLYLAVEDIDHTRTKVKSPQTNGICERFHKTLLDEFYRVAFARRYDTPDALQADPDKRMVIYNEQRTHQVAGVSARPRCKLSSTARAWAREKQNVEMAA